jgi:hypothetical protein
MNLLETAIMAEDPEVMIIESPAPAPAAHSRSPLAPPGGLVGHEWMAELLQNGFLPTATERFAWELVVPSPPESGAGDGEALEPRQAQAGPETPRRRSPPHPSASRVSGSQRCRQFKTLVNFTRYLEQLEQLADEKDCRPALDELVTNLLMGSLDAATFVAELETLLNMVRPHGAAGETMISTLTHSTARFQVRPCRLLACGL